MRSKKPNSNTTGPSWRVCPYHVYSVGLNSRAKIAQAMDETRQELRGAKTDEARQEAAWTLELLVEEKRKHEQSIEKGKKTRRENKRAARFKRMGGQTEFSPVQLGSLFDSVVKTADEDERMIVRQSGAGCDAAGTPRKKKLLLRKRRLGSGSRGKRTASES